MAASALTAGAILWASCLGGGDGKSITKFERRATYHARGSPNGVEEVDKVRMERRGLVLPDAPHKVPELRGGGQLLSRCMCVGLG